MLGDLDAEEIEEVLHSEVIGRIGCVSEGWPYVVPISYAYDGESIYAHSAEGLKIGAMRDSPRVCFEVERIESMKKWRTVIARGQFEPVWRDDEERAMDLLAARLASAMPHDASHVDRHEDVHRHEGVWRPVLFRIRLVAKTGRFEQA
jgi:nitroimidazol reductase NimA-like FMN-containing flavoprotein (pyridoxamine 5'-phosphate oxidase superfamily)